MQAGMYCGQKVKADQIMMLQKALPPIPTGNVYVTGYFQSPSFTFGTTTLTNSSIGTIGNYDILVIKYDSSGNPLWAKGAAGTSGEYAENISTDANGNIFVNRKFL